jgi:hypothetical protein
VPRTKVFVSYSHRDHHWLERLRVHLGVLERRELVHLWTDELIEIGEAWEEKIKTALSESKVAVLLISPGFLASDYIWKEEMSHILAHEKEGMKVFPLIVRPCAWKIEEVLKKSQARPAGGRALSMGNEAQVDLDLAAFVYELTERVEQLPETLLATQERELAEQYQASASLPVVRNRGDQPDQKRSDAEPDRAALATHATAAQRDGGNPYSGQRGGPSGEQGVPFG